MNYTEEEAFNIINVNLEKIKDDFFKNSCDTNQRKQFQLNSLSTISIVLGYVADNDNKLRYAVRTNWDYYQSIGCYKEKYGYKQYILSYRAIVELFNKFDYKLQQQTKDNQHIGTTFDSFGDEMKEDYTHNLFSKLIEDRRIALTNKKQELVTKIEKIDAALTSLDSLINIDEVLASV